MCLEVRNAPDGCFQGGQQGIRSVTVGDVFVTYAVLLDHVPNMNLDKEADVFQIEQHSVDGGVHKIKKMS